MKINIFEAVDYPTALFAAEMHGQIALLKWLLDQGAEMNKLLLSRFPYFCYQILNNRDIIAQEEQTLPPWLSAEESDHDMESLDDLLRNNADCQGWISENLAWRLCHFGIAVDQDAISTEFTTEGTEFLLVLESESDSGSELGDGIPERASQKLVSTFIYLNFDMLFKSGFRQ